MFFWKKKKEEEEEEEEKEDNEKFSSRNIEYGETISFFSKWFKEFDPFSIKFMIKFWDQLIKNRRIKLHSCSIDFQIHLFFTENEIISFQTMSNQISLILQNTFLLLESYSNKICYKNESFSSFFLKRNQTISN